MKRLLTLIVLVVIGIQTVDPAFARPRRVIVRRGPYRRSVVVVRRGWPLRRPLRAVVIHPLRGAAVLSVTTFMAPVVWAPVIVERPAADVLVWEDGETLNKDEDWTEFTLACHNTGRQVFLETTGGKVQLDWAEVVFGNGEAQVVDFNEKTRDPGFYSLLDFKDGRLVDHVRLVARAKSDEARVVLRMEK
jgi:hypothetical protein